MKEKFSWGKYLEILNDKQHEHSYITDFKARDYVESFIPNHIYKYFSFDEKDEENKRRLNRFAQGQIWFSRYKNLNDPYDLCMIKEEMLTVEAAANLTDVKKTREVICFTDSYKNKLMWAHYGSSFTGYCIEFIVDSKIGVAPVEYIDRKVDFTKEYTAFFNAKEEILKNINGLEDEYLGLIKNINPIFFFKDKCWKYEKEMRIVAFPATPDDKDCNGGLHNLDEYRLRISKIICGCNCKDKNIEMLKSVCKKINRKRKREQLKRIFIALKNNSKIVDDARNYRPQATIKEIAEHCFNVKYSKETSVMLVQLVLKANLQLSEMEIKFD